MDREQIQKAIAAQESLRAALGDAVVDMTVAALKEKLAAAPPAEQRKAVTILFADVSGFTAMSERLDAEEVRDRMNALWARLDACVTSRGGRIDKHIGDAVMALFGADAGREDDPERAVRAALAMQEELGAFSADLKMRIGLNTGPVLLGGVGSNSEFTAMGDAVNLASRLEHAAPVGGILVSHDLYRHVRGVFHVEAQAPLTVKGKVQPVQTYLVRGAKPRAFQSATRGLDIETRMVGRDAELARLEAHWDAVAGGGGSRVVTVTGEAGVGKSRLLAEFIKRLEARSAHLLKGRASPDTAERPYGLLRDVVSFQYEILDGDGTAAARAKLEEGVRRALPRDPDAAGKARALGGLLGFDDGVRGDPREVRELALAGLSAVLEAAEPAVLLLEDVHWGDDASLEVVARLSGNKRRLLVLCLARATLYERRPGWGLTSERMDLAPLSASDSGLLVDEILRAVGSPPPALRELLVAGAEGNPFYVEELVRMLIEEGVIDRSSEPWKVDAGRLAGLKVPPTLVGVLQARLDGLAPAERELAQRAAVVGRVFWDAAVDASPEALAALETREMVRRRRTSAFPGTAEYIFKHALLRDVAYEGVLLKNRKEHHRRAAEWLEACGGERAAEFGALIAEHYERAGEGAKAAAHLEKAAVRAARAAAYKEADAMLERALVLDPARFSSMLELAAVRRLDSRYEDAERRYEECRKDPSGRCVPTALAGLAYVARARGRLQEAVSLAMEAVGAARGRSEAAAEAAALVELAAVLHDLGEHSRGRIAAEEALALYRGLGDRFGEGLVFNDLGVSLFSQGKHLEAFESYEKARAAYAEAGSPLDAMLARANAGQALIPLGRLDEARGMISEALDFQRRNAILSHLAGTVDSLAELFEKLGDRPAAAREFRRALQLNLRRGMKGSVVTNLAGLARLRGDAALAALVLAHPSCNAEGRSRASSVPGAAAAVPDKTFEEALAAEAG